MRNKILTSTLTDDVFADYGKSAKATQNAVSSSTPTLGCLASHAIDGDFSKGVCTNVEESSWIQIELGPTLYEVISVYNNGTFFNCES